MFLDCFLFITTSKQLTDKYNLKKNIHCQNPVCGHKNYSVSNLIYIAHDGSRWTVSDIWLGRGPNPPSDHGASLECCRDLSSPWRSKQSIKQSPRCWAGLRTKHAPCVSHMAASFAKVTLQMDIASSTFVHNKCWAVAECPSPPRLKLAAFRKHISATGQTQSLPPSIPAPTGCLHI